MITTPQLEVLADELQIYDVVQGGWEHEGRGFPINASHTLTHLNTILTGKSFYDRTKVVGEIAPDNLQYALRFVRWQDLDLSLVKSTAESTASIAEAIEKQHKLHPFEPLPKAAFLGAIGGLAVYSGDIDHDSLRDAADTDVERKKVAFITSSLLLHSVELQIEEFKFDPVQSFRTRLAGLRKRFNIPEP